MPHMEQTRPAILPAINKDGLWDGYSTVQPFGFPVVGLLAEELLGDGGHAVPRCTGPLSFFAG